jgi:cytochrome c biogenesis protein CcdA
MKKIYLILLLTIFIPASVFAQASKKKAVYFFSETCSHCYQVDQYFTASGIYRDYEIKKLNIADPENLELINRFSDAFGIKSEDRAVPAVFFADSVLIGDEDIIGEFKSKIGAADASEFPTPEGVTKAREEKIKNAEEEAKNRLARSSIPLPILIGAAFVDASNPCALAVLILLLATVMGAKGKNSALLAGLLFSLAIFMSYFLMGIGAYRAITAFSLPKYFSLGIGIFSIIIGLANLKDVFWYGKGFIMEVPLSWRPKMQALIKKATSPLGAFTVGFLVSLFLVPCASGPYVAILGLLAQKVETAKTALLLVLYNFVFVLPMLIITFAMYFFNARMGKLEAWRQRNLRLLHAIAAGVMFFIGGYLIYNWV